MANPNVTIAGRLASDPEFKSLPTGSLLKFRVITNDRMKTQTGEWVDKDTSGWNIEVWSKLADASNGVLKKGMGVVVSGTMKKRSYEKDGIKKEVTELRASDVAVDVYSMSKSAPRVTDSNNFDNVWNTDEVDAPF
jgi:single-strand DNA-binding protein